MFVPDWTAPSRLQVADVAAMARGAGQHPRAVGILDALDWAGTVPNRDAAAQEATRLKMAAGDDEHARARAETLYWLTGVVTAPPVGIPRRNPDGTTPTARQLLEERIAREPHRSWHMPELRRPAELAAEREAREHQRLAAIVDSVRP